MPWGSLVIHLTDFGRALTKNIKTKRKETVLTINDMHEVDVFIIATLGSNLDSEFKLCSDESQRGL